MLEPQKADASLVLKKKVLKHVSDSILLGVVDIAADLLVES